MALISAVLQYRGIAETCLNFLRTASRSPPEPRVAVLNRLLKTDELEYHEAIPFFHHVPGADQPRMMGA